jgi:hypothetical protein
VKQGRPQLTPETSPIGQLAANTRSASSGTRGATPAILRTQSPDDITPIRAEPTKATIAVSPESQVVVASASGSVYAAMADKAGLGPNNADHSMNNKSTKREPSVYDASLGNSVLRR